MNNLVYSININTDPKLSENSLLKSRTEHQKTFMIEVILVLEKIIK